MTTEPDPAVVPAAPSRSADGGYDTDVVIVGAGVAGLFAAARLPQQLDVIVVDKGVPGRSGSSPWAQGGLAVAIGDDDSPDLHAADTARAGDGLCDPTALAVLTGEAPRRLEQLISLGAEFDRDDGGHLHLAREGGQSVARSVHRADATGAEMIRALRSAVRERVTRLPGTVVALSVGSDGRVDGLWAQEGEELRRVRAAATLLATGGCGGLFAATTNQDSATGDGLALALRAGAAVRDLEFVQFHPTGLAIEGAWRFLLTEALRGAGATLHDEDGHRFMVGLHPDAELAPRHVVAKAILTQREGRAWLDATGIGADALEHEFPTVLAGAARYGYDLAAERVPVTPAAHYMVGGVRTDLWARTSLPGLYAAGEVASTGVHGANRMAGNSLTEALVFGARAAEAITLELGHAPAPRSTDEPPVALGTLLPDDEADTVRAHLRHAMWAGAGPIRTADSLAKVSDTLRDLETSLTDGHAIRHVELWHALTSATLIAHFAALRPETRGGHVRDDHPETDKAWQIHLEQVGL